MGTFVRKVSIAGLLIAAMIFGSTTAWAEQWNLTMDQGLRYTGFAKEPKLIEFDNTLYAFWTENDDNTVYSIRAMQYENGEWVQVNNGDPLNFDSALFAENPSLAVYNFKTSQSHHLQ